MYNQRVENGLAGYLCRGIPGTAICADLISECMRYLIISALPQRSYTCPSPRIYVTFSRMYPKELCQRYLTITGKSPALLSILFFRSSFLCYVVFNQIFTSCVFTDYNNVLKIKSVAYFSQWSHTGQLDFCN